MVNLFANLDMLTFSRCSFLVSSHSSEREEEREKKRRRQGLGIEGLEDDACRSLKGVRKLEGLRS